MLHENYTEKCDIWSCGVILYILLSGSPPFAGSSNDEIMHKVEKGIYSFSGAHWKHVSGEAINLIKRMMTYRPKKRITAEQALVDPWMANYSSKKLTGTTEVLSCIGNLRSFHARSIMHQAVLSFMAAHIINQDEEKKLRDIFTGLDKDHNGLLSENELVEGYKLLFNGDIAAAEKEARRTMQNIDVNRNGTIDYNGNDSALNSE